MTDTATPDPKAETDMPPRQRSDFLQAEVVSVLNDPAADWHLQPLIVCHALAQVLSRVMTFVVELDASRLPYCLALLDMVRQRVADAAIPAKVSH